MASQTFSAGVAIGSATATGHLKPGFGSSHCGILGSVMVPSNVAYNDPHNTHVNNVSPWQNFQIFEADSFSGFLAIIFGIQRLNHIVTFSDRPERPHLTATHFLHQRPPFLSSARMSECHRRPLFSGGL